MIKIIHLPIPLPLPNCFLSLHAMESTSTTPQFSEQEIVRRNKLEEIRKLGIDPYPAAEFKVNVTAKDIHENYERDKTNYKDVSIAGRLMGIRIMGNAAFAALQDATGRIQVYIRRDDVCPGE